MFHVNFKAVYNRVITNKNLNHEKSFILFQLVQQKYYNNKIRNK